MSHFLCRSETLTKKKPSVIIIEKDKEYMQNGHRCDICVTTQEHNFSKRLFACNCYI